MVRYMNHVHHDHDHGLRCGHSSDVTITKSAVSAITPIIASYGRVGVNTKIGAGTEMHMTLDT